LKEEEKPMPEVTSFPPGAFCWIELTTSDGEAAKRFYCDLFGWTANEIPMEPGQPPYVMLQKNGKDVGALYENKQVPHPSWLSYIAVISADEAAAKAKSLGATALQEPFDVFDVGRMAVLSDPEGAVFALWQAGRHHGMSIAGESNTYCWDELQTRQRDQAKEFYGSLFGWTLKESPEYIEAHLGEQAIGGIFDMGNAVPQHVPPHWQPYFAVDDCDATVQKASSLGGGALMPATDIPNVGRFAVLRDPQGATFAVIKLNQR
jgi:predicted enzyme related to lactoylglutathione lyase